MNSEDKQIDILFKEGFSKQKFEIPEEYKADLKKRLAKRKKRIILFWFSIIGVSVTVLISLLHLPTKNNTELYNSKSPLQSADNHVKEETILVSTKDTKSMNEIETSSFENNKKKNVEVKNYKKNKLNNQDKIFNHKEKTREKYISNSQQKNVQSVLERKENLNLISKDAGTPSLDNFNKNKIKTNYLIDYLSVKKLELESNLINKQFITYQKDKDDIAGKNNLKKERVINLLLSLGITSSFNKVKYLGNEFEYYLSNTKERTTINYDFNANVLVKNKFIFGTGIGLNQHRYDYDFNTINRGFDTTITLDSTYVFQYTSINKVL